MTTTIREQQLLLAKIAQQAERYEDMLSSMQKIVTQSAELTNEERNLLSIAFKNTIALRRSSWRVVSAMEQKEKQSKKVGIIRKYKTKIEAELNRYCNQTINLIDSELLPKSSTADSRVFYSKMKGDIYRYIAEYVTGSERQSTANNSLKAYEYAIEVASAHLKRTSPLKLGVILNYSVLLYEITTEPMKAVQVAKKGFDEAIADIDKLEDDGTQKDTTLILQLIKENLQLWTDELGDAAGVSNK